MYKAIQWRVVDKLMSIKIKCIKNIKLGIY